MAHSWYVIRTRPQCEYVAAEALERDGFEFFFPCVRKRRPRASRADTPLFPGYIFLRHDLEVLEWPAIRSMPGILGWVRFGSVTPTLPDKDISDLARRVENINEEGGLWTRFQKGERVRVVSGKMDSLAELVEEPNSPEARVRVLLEFMGRRIPAQVPCSQLQPVNGSWLEAIHRRRLRRTRGGQRWIRGFGPRTVPAVGRV